MTPWERKYRKAKRANPLRILSRQAHILYGKGYIQVLEERNLISRNTFYDKVKRRTLSNKTAEAISELLQVDSEKWYAGEK